MPKSKTSRPTKSSWDHICEIVEKNSDDYPIYDFEQEHFKKKYPGAVKPEEDILAAMLKTFLGKGRKDAQPRVEIKKKDPDNKDFLLHFQRMVWKWDDASVTLRWMFRDAEAKEIFAKRLLELTEVIANSEELTAL